MRVTPHKTFTQLKRGAKMKKVELSINIKCSLTTCELIENLRRRVNNVETMTFIDNLEYEERINIREVLHDIPLPKNLFYDYTLQQWID
jgi:hypothetical protein